MKLDIKTNYILEHNCFSGLPASIAEWKKRDYRLSHAEAWDFVVQYETKEDSMVTYGLPVEPCSICLDLLKTYSGINLLYHGYDDTTEKFLMMLKEELSQHRPMIIILDYFWCPWSKEVSKITHMPDHATLVIGFNESGLICRDYNQSYDKCILPFENVSKIVCYYTIAIDEQPNIIYNYHDILNRSIRVIENHDIFNAMREFGKFIKESFNPCKDLELVENNAYIPKLFQIELMAEGRYLYSKTLRAINEKHNIELLTNIADSLEAIKSLWSIAKVLLTKIYLLRDLSLKDILAEKFIEIANCEEEIYNFLVILNGN